MRRLCELQTLRAGIVAGLMRYNPAVIALVDRLKARGRLKGKQIVIAAMRKLLVLCFGVLKTGKEFDPAMAVWKKSGASRHSLASIAW